MDSSNVNHDVYNLWDFSGERPNPDHNWRMGLTPRRASEETEDTQLQTEVTLHEPWNDIYTLWDFNGSLDIEDEAWRWGLETVRHTLNRMPDEEDPQGTDADNDALPTHPRARERRSSIAGGEQASRGESSTSMRSSRSDTTHSSSTQTRSVTPTAELHHPRPRRYDDLYGYPSRTPFVERSRYRNRTACLESLQAQTEATLSESKTLSPQACREGAPSPEDFSETKSNTTTESSGRSNSEARLHPEADTVLPENRPLSSHRQRPLSRSAEDLSDVRDTSEDSAHADLSTSAAVADSPRSPSPDTEDLSEAVGGTIENHDRDDASTTGTSSAAVPGSHRQPSPDIRSSLSRSPEGVSEAVSDTAEDIGPIDDSTTGAIPEPVASSHRSASQDRQASLSPCPQYVSGAVGATIEDSASNDATTIGASPIAVEGGSDRFSSQGSRSSLSPIPKDLSETMEVDDITEEPALGRPSPPAFDYPAEAMVISAEESEHEQDDPMSSIHLEGSVIPEPPIPYEQDEQMIAESRQVSEGNQSTPTSPAPPSRVYVLASPFEPILLFIYGPLTYSEVLRDLLWPSDGTSSEETSESSDSPASSSSSEPAPHQLPTPPKTPQLPAASATPSSEPSRDSTPEHVLWDDVHIRGFCARTFGGIPYVMRVPPDPWGQLQVLHGAAFTVVNREHLDILLTYHEGAGDGDLTAVDIYFPAEVQGGLEQGDRGSEQDDEDDSEEEDDLEEEEYERERVYERKEGWTYVYEGVNLEDPIDMEVPLHEIPGFGIFDLSG